jgi:hypothetical protein
MRRCLVLAPCVALIFAGAANAQPKLYDAYACTLQGTTGLTYIIEGSSYGTLRGACLAFKRTLSQSELRWGLHPPSFSSGETPQATWMSNRLRLKLTLLAVRVPLLKQLIRAVNAQLSPAVWQRVATSNYP